MERIKIQEIIPLTIQGEGMNRGMPCSFIRLFGCPVGCEWCDTGYSKSSESLPSYTGLSIDKIKKQLGSNNIVITGGEPLVNQHFDCIVNSLLAEGKRVFVETSGIKYNPILKDVFVTVSPKEHLFNNGLNRLDPLIISSVDEWKLIISQPSDFDYYKDFLFLGGFKPISLQPEWSKRDDMLEFCIDTANNYGFKVSVQEHKLIGVR